MTSSDSSHNLCEPTLAEQTVVVIGGSSGIVLVGRDPTHLEQIVPGA